MFPITFEKKRAERFTQCLAEGNPIGAVRTVDEILALAGACFFFLFSHGPIFRRAAAEMQGQITETPKHPEHAEADDELVFNDIHAAIEFAGHLAMLIHDGEYDESYEQLIRCLVTETSEVEKQLVPLSGFKTTKNLLDEDSQPEQ